MSHTSFDPTEQYFIFSSGEQEGPFTLLELQSMWRSGSLATSSQYWKEGLEEWQSITDLHELLDLPEHALADEQGKTRQQNTPTEHKEKQADWGLVSFGTLVALTAIIPLIGFVVGYRGLSNPARREKAAGLIGIAAVSSIAAIVFIFGDFGPNLSAASPLISASQPRRIVTYDHYQRIREGMSYSAVCSTIGTGGQEVSRNRFDGVPGAAPAISTVMYQWENADGSNMNAIFQNDSLVQKAQSGL